MDHQKAIIATHERLAAVQARHSAARAACVELRACRVLLAAIAADKHSLGQAQDILRERSEDHHERLAKITRELTIAERAKDVAHKMAGVGKKKVKA